MAAFTTIAAGAAAVAAAGGSTASFLQAGKQRRLQADAEADAAKALEEARKRTEVNYYDQLGINKEPYALEREALLTQGAQAIEAGRESERGVAATAGRIQAQQNLAQQGVTTAMGKEMSDLEKLQAQEDSRLRDVNLQLDMGEIAGAQQAAADAANKAAAATQAGFTQAASAIQQGVAAGVPLFSKQALPGAPNTSLQASAKMAGLGGSYTPPQFNTNAAWANGINPFQVAPSINYPTQPIGGFTTQPAMPFGGGNPLPTYTTPNYTFPKFP